MVTADPAGARVAATQGQFVVLIVPEGGTVRPAGGPATAVFVGDPDDPAVWAVAREMEAELRAGRKQA